MDSNGFPGFYEEITALLCEAERTRTDGTSQPVSRRRSDVSHPPLLKDRYALQEELGRGGAATVYRAADRVTGHQVAVKILNADAAGGRDAVERFGIEASVLRRLEHPGIVGIVDVCLDSGAPFVVLDYCSGGSVKQLVAARGPLRLRLATALLRQVLGGLEAAHAVGIVHRDIKPGNILFDDRGRAMLADFGIAAVPDSGVVTRTGVVMGSRAFMAPETWAGCSFATVRSDLYSVGATLYYLLTGELPSGMFAAPPDDERWAAVPEAVRPLLIRAMHAYPRERFGGAVELRRALRAL